MKKLYLLLSALFVLSGVGFAQLENTARVTLTFTPTSGSAVVATATDTGSGLAVDGPVTLMESTDYSVIVSLQDAAGGDLTGGVTAAANDHQIFFQPTGSILNGDVTAADTDGNGLQLKWIFL